MARDKRNISAGLDALLGGRPAPTRKEEPESTPVRENEAEMNHGGTSKIKNRYPTSVIVDRVKYEKIRIIALNNGLNINEVIDVALDLAIESYEKNNGVITLGESRISASEVICPRKSKSR